MIGRWQTGEEISPKSQDADIENVRVTKHFNSSMLEGFFILISKLQEGSRPAIFPISPRWPMGLRFFDSSPLEKGEKFLLPLKKKGGGEGFKCYDFLNSTYANMRMAKAEHIQAKTSP